MDGCRVLFCIINNAFGKLKNISAVALNFNLIPSCTELPHAHGKWSLLLFVCALMGLSILSAECLCQPEQVLMWEQTLVWELG